jgi:hypothetical protein
MFAQGRKDGRQKQTITMSLRRFAKGDTKGIIEKNTFIQTIILFFVSDACIPTLCKYQSLEFLH